MATYQLIKNGEVVNTIMAEEIDSISNQYDQIINLSAIEMPPVVESDFEPTPPARIWTQANVRSALTLAEKTKWDNDSAPEVKTAKIEIGFGLEEAAITEVLDFLVDASVISADSKAAVLA